MGLPLFSILFIFKTRPQPSRDPKLSLPSYLGSSLCYFGMPKFSNSFLLSCSPSGVHVPLGRNVYRRVRVQRILLELSHARNASHFHISFSTVQNIFLISLHPVNNNCHPASPVYHDCGVTRCYPSFSFPIQVRVVATFQGNMVESWPNAQLISCSRRYQEGGGRRATQ